MHMSSQRQIVVLIIELFQALSQYANHDALPITQLQLLSVLLGLLFGRRNIHPVHPGPTEA